jgi:UrcA family protein
MNATLLKLAVAAAASLMVGGLVLAQSTEEVTVTASAVAEKSAGRTATGAHIVDMSVSYAVGYAGLDLASHAGAMELEKRINDASRMACKEIGRHRPLAQLTPDEDGCAKAAAAKAMVRAHELIAEAGKKPAK